MSRMPAKLKKVKIANNTVKSIFQSDMAVNGHITEIEYKTSGGNVKISATPNLSMNPYFYFYSRPANWQS